jgi:transcriptional regulator with XRE-family HTH domain
MLNNQNIKAEMARNSFGNEQMAEKLGMSGNSYRFKMNGKREFTLEEFYKMADLFNCSLDYLAARVPQQYQEAKTG